MIPCRIVVTPVAAEDLRRYMAYLSKVKKNPQAVKNVLQDFRETKEHLSYVAASISEPASEELRRRGLKRMNFMKHNYFMLFYVADHNVYVTDIFHGLEDFESKLR